MHKTHEDDFFIGRLTRFDAKEAELID